MRTPPRSPLTSSRRRTPRKSASAAAARSEVEPGRPSAASAARAFSTLWPPAPPGRAPPAPARRTRTPRSSPAPAAPSVRRASLTGNSCRRRLGEGCPTDALDGPALAARGRQDRDAGLGGEADEGLDQGLERAPFRVVVHLDVGDDGDLGVEAEEAAVGLVGLGDHPLALAPAGVGGSAVGAEAGDLAADEEGRVLAEAAQRPDGHRGRRRLAVGAGDRDQPLLGAELGEQFAAVDDLLAALAGQRQLRVAVADRGRDDDLGALGQVGGVVADRRLDPRPAQPLHIRGLAAVAAADRRAEPGADHREPAHPGPADADEVQLAARSSRSSRSALRAALGSLQDLVGDRPRRVRFRQAARRARHLLQPRRVAEDPLHLGQQRRRVEGVVFDDLRRARPLHPTRVRPLVVGRRVGERDQDRRATGGGELEDRAARASQDQVAGREYVAEVRLVLDQLVALFIWSGSGVEALAQRRVVARPRQVQARGSRGPRARRTPRPRRS